MKPAHPVGAIAAGVVLVGAGIMAFQQAGSSTPDSPQQLPPSREITEGIGPSADDPVPQVEGVPESWGESMQQQRAAGWTAFIIEGDRTAYKAWEFNRPDNPAAPGDWTDVVDAEGTPIGVYVHPIGFVATEDFDEDTFDWRAEAARRGASPEWIEQQDQAGTAAAQK
jgi:hypothetical protein